MSDCLKNLRFFDFTTSSKCLCLGAWESWEISKSFFRSLHVEHVSLADLIAQEICRRSQLAQSIAIAHRQGHSVSAEIQVTLVRRWFMARKPDAGFFLYGFPATLLQARILDEWLESRGECLDLVLNAPDNASASIVLDYYRIHGLKTMTLSPTADLLHDSD